MGLVIVGPKDDAEIAAGAVVHCAQKIGLRARRRPLLFDGDHPTVLQFKRRNIDGVGGCMLAAEVLPELIADYVAA